MSIDGVREVLLWCAAINYGLVLFWFLLFAGAHDWMQRLHGRWFQLSIERFDTVQYTGMAIYKIAILLFNVVPYVALRIAA